MLIFRFYKISSQIEVYVNTFHSVVSTVEWQVGNLQLEPT